MRDGECAKCGSNLTADHKCPEIYQTRTHAADEITTLRAALTAAREENERLKGELETERMRLAGCGVAAMCNTEESRAQQLIGRGNLYYSASYQDVCDAVQREMDLRAKVERVESVVSFEYGRWFDDETNCGIYVRAALNKVNEALKEAQ